MRNFYSKTQLLFLLAIILISVNIFTVFSEWGTDASRPNKDTINIVLNESWLELFILFINIVITSSIFVIIYLKIIQPLRKAAFVAQKFISIDEIQKHNNNTIDSLNDVSYLKNTVEILCEKEKHNQWQSEGFVKLSHILNEIYAAHHNLGENILTFLVQYTAAHAGAIYLVSETKSEFIRLYATGFAQLPAKRSSLSDGLLATAYKQNQLIRISENIDKNHFVGTPFLQITPQSLLILPLSHANKVQGIIELVFVTELTQEKINFLQSVSSNIAATLADAKHDFKVEKMLEQSKEMSYMLQQQEEELRQNLEELEANGEHLKNQMRESILVKNELASRMKVLNQSALLTESDIYGNITYANDAFCKVSKYSLEECLGKPHSLVRHPDSSKELFTSMWETIKSGKIFRATYKNRAKDGTSYWVEANIAPVFDDNDKIIKYIGIRFDVTERVEREIQVSKLLLESQNYSKELRTKEEILKQNIEELRASEEETIKHLRLLEVAQNELKSRIEVLNNSALVTESDLYGNITYANQKFCEVSKYSLDECIGKPHNILRHPDMPKETFRQMWQTIKNGGIFKGIIINKDKNGNDYWVDATIAPIFNNNGVPIKYISVRFDITQQVRQGKQIEILLTEALDINKKLQEQDDELRKTNEQLEASSDLLEEANETLEQKVIDRTSEIFAQKEKIAYQKDQIESSIRYAKRIQEAILPTPDEIREELPNSFVVYQPKDIVSGDFYWFKKRNHLIFIAAVDCTGHGVPGAMLSMVGEGILSYIVGELGIVNANEILEMMHILVRQQLKQNLNSEVRDGMDLVLCVIDTQKQELQFAGANNPLIYVQNEILTVIKGDKLPIGGFQHEEERKFTSHTLDISQPTVFYLCTDGYKDQFGGKDVKKFMSRNLNNLLFQIYNLPILEQKRILKETIYLWMQEGKSKQIDDITLLGVKWGI